MPERRTALITGITGQVRPSEAAPQVGDPSRARTELGWRPSLSFEELVHRMVDADLRALVDERRSADGESAPAGLGPRPSTA